ncbi:MAG: DNA-3-methyladenine glycosylase [Rhodobacterales bacterium RIFCSPHIGHO2_02_FULL_62_130]|nr:MAG: DNA-3-methyladenine glycosylase [Rhodobacterales bacterium RIFCSPHIGHO2_12_FULL_62_75]OHC59741.1 MAG: DNA-3-methyladenine glycosylase [Rhodobacterales bacterium RIFCSPHIGHO2_02_FULL_62_130]
MPHPDLPLPDLPRCAWCGTDPLYTAYHDTEWGRPEHDPRALWECLILESFQAGLSWITILRRRETFRTAFKGFHPETIATWGEAEILRLLGDPGIIRHRGKIEATIAGAKAYLRLEARQGFADFIWSHVNHSPQISAPASRSEIPAETETARRLSKSLKAEGFKFVGPTITYAFMQAAGLVNDHVATCHRYGQP